MGRYWLLAVVLAAVAIGFALPKPGGRDEVNQTSQFTTLSMR